MKGKLRLAAILAALLLLLGAVATWDEWRTKKDKDEEKTKNHLAEFKPEDVLELDYISKAASPDADGAEAGKHEDDQKDSGAVEISAVKKDGVWRLTKPVDALADTATIDGLIKTITDYTYAKVITDKRDQWAEYGVLEPTRRISLRFGGNAAAPFTLYLGNKAPVAFNAYMRTSSDDRVLMGSQHILVSTSKSLNDFRDKTLAKIDEAKIKSLSYQARGAAAVELARADGKYSIVQPEKLDADSAAVKDFIDALNAIRVTGFIDAPDEATRQLFAQPLAAITWQEESGVKVALKVAEKDGKLLATFDPSQRVYSLPDEYKSKLKKELTDFRNRRILDADALDTKSVDVDGTVYKNIEGNWYTAADAEQFDDKGKFKGAGKAKPAEKPNVRAFMVDLEFAKTDRFIPLDDPLAKGLSGPPAHRITLSYFDQTKKPMQIDLFKIDTDPSHYLVRRTGGRYVYQVATSAFNSMLPGKAPVPGGEAPAGLPGAEPLGGDHEGLAPPADGGDNSGLIDLGNAGKTG